MNLKGIGFLAGGGVVGFTAGVIYATAVLTKALEEALLEGKQEAKTAIQVGDDINWESDGMLMFPKPKQVLRIIDSEEHGKYVFVDGVDTGIPYDQCVKE